MISTLSIITHSFHYKLLTQFNKRILKDLYAISKIENPVKFPVQIKKFTVLRSPHIDKKSREQFELRTYKNLYKITFHSEMEESKILELFKKKAFSGIGVSLKRELKIVL